MCLLRFINLQNVWYDKYLKNSFTPLIYGKLFSTTYDFMII